MRRSSNPRTEEGGLEVRDANLVLIEGRQSAFKKGKKKKNGSHRREQQTRQAEGGTTGEGHSVLFGGIKSE